jgi:hypothetical protein
MSGEQLPGNAENVCPGKLLQGAEIEKYRGNKLITIRDAEIQDASRILEISAHSITAAASSAAGTT